VTTDDLAITTATIGGLARAAPESRRYLQFRAKARPINGHPPLSGTNSGAPRRQTYAPVRRGTFVPGASTNALVPPDEPFEGPQVVDCTVALVSQGPSPPVVHRAASDSDWRAKLASLRSLRPGWNKRGAAAPSERAITNAEAMAEAMARRGRAPTRVAPSAVGGVGITRRQGSRMAYAELYNDGSACALFADDDSEGTTFPFSTDPEGLHRILDRMEAYLDG
jgi:hypothetical protein